MLEGATFLMPGDDVAIRPRLEQWLQAKRLQPRIVGEFDDNALLQAFGRAGAGLFVAPTAIADDVVDQYRVVRVGRLETVSEQLFAITSERRLSHPAIVAISQTARDEVFGTTRDAGAAAGGEATAAAAIRLRRRSRLPKVAT